jgi:hypothetical protein
MLFSSGWQAFSQEINWLAEVASTILPYAP